MERHSKVVRWSKLWNNLEFLDVDEEQLDVDEGPENDNEIDNDNGMKIKQRKFNVKLNKVLSLGWVEILLQFYKPNISITTLEFS